MTYGTLRFHLKIIKKGTFEETVDLHGWIILKSILKEEYARRGMNSFTFGESQVRGSCGHINVLLGSRTCGMACPFQGLLSDTALYSYLGVCEQV